MIFSYARFETLSAWSPRAPVAAFPTGASRGGSTRRGHLGKLMSPRAQKKGRIRLLPETNL